MIELRNINKRFGNKVILNNVDLKVNTGEMIAIMGVRILKNHGIH